MTALRFILGAEGPLGAGIGHFAPRQAQIELAEAVATALRERSQLVAEAGTGTGKTFAYLTPALLEEGKFIVSTATKHLQDQLFKKDLPTLRKALAVDKRAVLLKGRANYLCRHRLDRAESDSAQRGHQDYRLLRSLRAWGGVTEHGDRAEFTELPEDHRLWYRVTSTTDNCVGQECEHYQACFVVKARRAALDADIVVINHHLFCADLALKETGFGELLPKADGFILDEAHQLPEIATRFFGQTLSSRGLLDLCDDTIAESLNGAADLRDLIALAESLPAEVMRLRHRLGDENQRAAWSHRRDDPTIRTTFDELGQQLETLTHWLDQASVRSTGLQACHRRAVALRQLLVDLQAPSEDAVQWYETTRAGFQLHASPLEIAPVFRKYLELLPVGWVFTSATLAVGDDFTHFTERLGIEAAAARRWDSPFDFARNALLYLPTDLPAPDAPDYTARIVERVRPLLEANPGGTFLLFTSYRALQQATAALQNQTERPLLVQGQAPRHDLLTRFRDAGNAVLLATSSFWEGVDVRGQALSCVIIDKLPFAAPGDPVLEARLTAMRARGRNPFNEYQVPQAVITLKQGVGRLIRDVDDRGLLVLCDPRIGRMSYGRRFLASLPPLPVTHDVHEAEIFLRGL
ncbi:MAG: ATP-dependent DNA helicase [Thiotrichales bacterium]